MMATKKAGGSTKNLRDSRGQRLGLKRNHMQYVKSGTIIVQQRGQKYKCGIMTYYGKQHAIHARRDGIVHFSKYNNKTYIKDNEKYIIYGSKGLLGSSNHKNRIKSQKPITPEIINLKITSLFDPLATVIIFLPNIYYRKYIQLIEYYQIILKGPDVTLKNLALNKVYLMHHMQDYFLTTICNSEKIIVFINNDINQKKINTLYQNLKNKNIIFINVDSFNTKELIDIFQTLILRKNSCVEVVS